MKTLKNLLVLLFTALLFGAGCSNSAINLNGTYVNHAASEFSIADDTLVVEHTGGLDYLIHRRTGYQLLDDAGRPGKRILEKEEWQAVYDEGSGTMTENSKSRVISFEVDKGELKLENSRFQRIN
ncbi:hypothetical protein SAMN04487898_12297 [Pedobacter sp. ok626]|uniref:hypothetical protein n=1 Tax=Pedobacter sp. ok626 TaxID=1761882 RepID=UPI000880EE19|nr:hypothetical protein [Pedobacter sp. ok626]SDL67898.1 hypothetical protein SAMN04487898_12297 [Pedobacter sp. ok626]